MMHMNNKAVVPLVVLFAYLALLAGMVISDVGEPSSGKIYITDWDLVAIIIVFTSLPAWLGFEVGKNLKGE